MTTITPALLRIADKLQEQRMNAQSPAYDGWFPQSADEKKFRQKLQANYNELQDVAATAFQEGHDDFAITIMSAADKIKEAEMILQALAHEVSPPIQFTDDNPAALKCNGHY